MIRFSFYLTEKDEPFQPTHPNKITREHLSDEDHHAITKGVNVYARAGHEYNSEARKTGKAPIRHGTNEQSHRIIRMNDALERNKHKLGIEGKSTVYHGMRREPHFDEHGHTKVHGITSTTTQHDKVITHTTRAKSGDAEEKAHVHRILKGEPVHVLRIHSDSEKHKSRPIYVAHAMSQNHKKNEHEAMFPAGQKFKKTGEDMAEKHVTITHPDTGKRIKHKAIIHYHDVEPA